MQHAQHLSGGSSSTLHYREPGVPGEVADALHET